MKKTVYIDMDDVIVDFQSGIDKLDEKTRKEFKDDLDEVPGIFSLMDPVPGAIESVKKLSAHFELYVLSTAPWKNPLAWTDKVKWIQKYFGADKGSVFYKRLIISHHKELNKGDFLIDDRKKNGSDGFSGELIHFKSSRFPDWDSVTDYLLKKI